MSTAQDVAAAPVFALRGVERRFGDHAAVSHLDLDVHAGERVALLGPSGAGKSTLLRLLTGALEPTRGEIRAFGVDLAGPDRRARLGVQRRVGSLTQDLALIPHVRVLHNVNAGRLGQWSALRALRSLVSTSPDAVATAALAEVGMGWAVHARTDQLSGGERQRVALARLLVQRADVVVADEPVSSLDPATSDRVLEVLCAGAATCVVSLHQPELVGGRFTRVVGMREGNVTLDVPAAELTAGHLVELYARA